MVDERGARAPRAAYARRGCRRDEKRRGQSRSGCCVRGHGDERVCVRGTVQTLSDRRAAVAGPEVVALEPKQEEGVVAHTPVSVEIKSPQLATPRRVP